MRRKRDNYKVFQGTQDAACDNTRAVVDYFYVKENILKMNENTFCIELSYLFFFKENKPKMYT